MIDDIFQGASLKKKRALQLIEELIKLAQEFEEADFYTFRVEKDIETGRYRLIFAVTKPIPDEFALLIGDTVHNLRSALDQLVFAIASQAGGKPDRIFFPVSDTEEKLKKNLDGSEIKKVAPKLADFFLNEIKPYKDGNYNIWALHQLDVTDKHRLVLPVLAVTRLNGFCAIDENNNRMCNCSARVERNGFINMIKTSAKMSITVPGEPEFMLFFDKEQPFEGQPVINTLNNLVETVANTIESFRSFVT
jgi:hypothetical protein